MTKRFVHFVAIAALALAAAGCGGTTGTGSGLGSGAAATPASAPAFVAIDSDLSSDQWRQVDKLLDKFPGKGKLLQNIRESLRKEAGGIDYEQDVKGAVGDEID